MRVMFRTARYMPPGMRVYGEYVDNGNSDPGPSWSQGGVLQQRNGSPQPGSFSFRSALAETQRQPESFFHAAPADPWQLSRLEIANNGPSENPVQVMSLRRPAPPENFVLAAVRRRHDRDVLTLRSPNGRAWYLGVNNDGELVRFAVDDEDEPHAGNIPTEVT